MAVAMIPKRRRWWLALEWFGTAVFSLVPDIPIVNRIIAQLFYYAFNKSFADLGGKKLFNERLILLKLDPASGNPLRTQVTDKELVKEYVRQTLGEGRSVPTAAVLRRVSEVRTFEFPLPCVVKPTHSSQEVMFLVDAQPSSEERAALSYWLRKSYFIANREPNYKRLEKKLIVEPLLGGEPGQLKDIKVFCYQGQPKMIQIDHSRFGKHLRDFFDMSGRPLAMQMRKPRAYEPFPYPEKLAEITEAAAKLSAPFNFIRTDFYVWRDQVLVGELTSFPGNCTQPFRPLEAEQLLARWFDDPREPIPESLYATQEGPISTSAGVGLIPASTP